MTCKDALMPTEMVGINLWIPLVLPPGGHAAPDVALCFVGFQYAAHLREQCGIVLGQTLDDVLVYGGF